MVDLPARSDKADAVLMTLHDLDEDRRARGLEDVVAQPDHVLYVTVVGRLCPGTEPEPPRGTDPLPPVNSDSSAGEGVSVSVVDTGWWKTALRTRSPRTGCPTSRPTRGTRRTSSARRSMSTRVMAPSSPE